MRARRRLASGIPTRGRSASFRKARDRAARYTATGAPRDDRSVPGASVCARPGWIDRRAASQSRDAARRRSGNRGRGGSRLGRSEKTHQGARNLTKAALPDSRTSASKFAEVRSTAPALAPTTRPMRAIARNATRILTCGGRTRGADQSINSRDGPTADRNSRSGGGRRANRGWTRAMRPRGRRWAIETVHTMDGTRTGSELARSRVGHCRNFCSFCPSAACHVFRPIRSEYCLFCRPRFSHGFRFSNKSHRTPHATKS